MITIMLYDKTLIPLYYNSFVQVHYEGMITIEGKNDRYQAPEQALAAHRLTAAFRSKLRA